MNGSLYDSKFVSMIVYTDSILFKEFITFLKDFKIDNKWEQQFVCVTIPRIYDL